MTSPINPYAAPQAELRDAASEDHDAATSRRRELIRHETQLKSVGSLYYLIGAMSVLTLIVMVPRITQTVGSDTFGTMVVVVVALMAIVYFVVGHGFRKVRPWVRIPGGLLAGLSLLSIPVGTLIGAYILYLMFCQRGRQVLSADYQAVIAATPHIRYQRTTGDWIALAIVLMLVVGIIALVVLGTGGR